MSSGGDGLLVNITAQYRNRAVLLSDYDRMRSFLRDMDYTGPGGTCNMEIHGKYFFWEKIMILPYNAMKMP